MSKVSLNCGRANHDKVAHCQRCDQTLSGTLKLDPPAGRHPLSLLVILSVLIIGVLLFILGD